MAWVILEREFAEPLTSDDVRRLASETQCLDLYRVRPVRSYLMPDGKRMLCVFEAPDAEAAQKIMANDPAVREGIMHAELYPYRVAFMR